jgi:hypothetical protein
MSKLELGGVQLSAKVSGCHDEENEGFFQVCWCYELGSIIVEAILLMVFYVAATSDYEDVGERRGAFGVRSGLSIEHKRWGIGRERNA